MMMAPPMGPHELGAEFVEDGVLRGAALVNRDGEYAIAFRDREVCASRPNLTGFDVVGLAMSSERDLERLIERCDRLGVEHGQVQGRGAGRTAFDVADPDRTVLRFIYAEEAVPDRFIGMNSGARRTSRVLSDPETGSRIGCPSIGLVMVSRQPVD
jgi:hypothetical protein